ncbi:hypothetical protein J3E68DRAFT_415571 [Trichoderma sp. SZMC 28012]
MMTMMVTYVLAHTTTAGRVSFLVAWALLAGFFCCFCRARKLFIEIVSTLLLARITHTGVITSQN